jgi:ankyrin repeat protein
LAARSNELAVTVKLVSANAKINQATRSGETPLYAACAAGSLSTAKHLVDSFARKDQATTSGATPLHAAASAGHDDLVALLLKAKPKQNVVASSVNLQTQLGETALFVACAAGATGAVSQLLAAPGTDANRKTRLGYSPLFAAASAGHPEVVKMLLAYKLPSTTAAAAAAGVAATGKTAGAKAESGLLAVDMDLASQVGESPVYAASRNGHASTVTLFCNAGANLNLQTVPARETALYRAAKNGEAKVCEVLLKHGADPTLVQKGGESPFYAAAAAGQTAALTALLANTHSNDKDAFNLAQKDGFTPMYGAARAGHVGALSALVAAGADVDQTSHKGESPLLVAARAGEVGAVEVLIAAGAKQYKASPNKGNELAELLSGMGFTQTAVGYGKRNTVQMPSSSSRSHV